MTGSTKNKERLIHEALSARQNLILGFARANGIDPRELGIAVGDEDEQDDPYDRRSRRDFANGYAIEVTLAALFGNKVWQHTGYRLMLGLNLLSPATGEILWELEVCCAGKETLLIWSWRTTKSTESPLPDYRAFLELPAIEGSITEEVTMRVIEKTLRYCGSLPKELDRA